MTRWLVGTWLALAACLPLGAVGQQFDAACTDGKLPYFAISGFNQTTSVPAGTGAGAAIQVGATSFWTYATPLALCKGVADGYVYSSAGSHTPVINAASEYNCAVQRTNSNGTLSQTSTNVFKHCGTRTMYEYPASIQAVAGAAPGVYTSTGATPTGGSSGGSTGGTVTLDATGAIAAWQAASAFDSTKAGDLLSLFGLFLAAAVAVLCLKWVYNFFKVDQ